jgi:hypothetical protein
VQLFPERDRRGRRLILLAALLSLIVHLVGGSLWSYLQQFTHHGGRPEGQVLAKIETITVERRPEPPAQPRAVPAAPRAAPPAAPRLHLPLPELPRLAEPTFAPHPAVRPPLRVHRPPSRVTAMVPLPSGARGAHAAAGAMSAEQIAALEGSFRKTIDQAQQAVAESPVPQHQVATTKQYNDVLHGSVDDIIGGTGLCDPMDEGSVRGVYTYYYLTCSIRYTDGMTERVSFPWPFRFTRRDDPFIYRDGRPHSFPPQAPPAGFVLRHPFALSRALCMYYHDECAAVLERERANNGPDNGGS